MQQTDGWTDAKEGIITLDPTSQKRMFHENTCKITHFHLGLIVVHHGIIKSQSNISISDGNVQMDISHVFPKQINPL